MWIRAIAVPIPFHFPPFRILVAFNKKKGRRLQPAASITLSGKLSNKNSRHNGPAFLQQLEEWESQFQIMLRIKKHDIPLEALYQRMGYFSTGGNFPIEKRAGIYYTQPCG